MIQRRRQEEKRLGRPDVKGRNAETRTEDDNTL